MGYTVEEVSERLGVPRPTLYRYLREYSVPHTRRSGRISIPEESLEQLRRVRDLHGEGLSSEVVRRRLSREEVGSEWLEERLREISDDLGELKEELWHSSSSDSGDAMRVLMARQNLLMSAVFNLTGMVEELMETSGRGRRASLESREENDSAVSPEQRGETILSRPVERSARAPYGRKFGLHAKRRRGGALGILFLVALLAGAAVLRIFL